MAKHQFIIDEEIDLFEKQVEADAQKKDLLNTSTYVNTLTTCVLNAPDDKSFTIGLFGEWGSGKSSIIKTFSKDVINKYSAEKKNVKVITYDAWKYANDSFRRMFLLQMQKDLGYKREQLMNSFYLNSSEDVDIKPRFNSTKLYIGLFISLLLIIGCYFIPISDPDAKILANTIVAMASLLYTIYVGAIQEMKVNIQKPHMFAPEQFEACYDEMIDMALGKKREIWQYIKRSESDTYYHRLIIVIDNVDRCSPELAYELLTNIKNFLGQKHNTIFIIPVDEEALKKHIIRNNPTLGHESDEFLRKFFNICIRIKPFHQEEMFDFADQLNLKYELGLNSNTIGLISQEFAHNPRRIIQMMNNLIVEFKNVPSQYVKTEESLICKLLILREEYPKFYKALVNDATLLFEKPKENQDSDDSLARFLYRTNSISQPYKDRLDVIESILSNSVVFDKIPQKVLDEVSSNETKGTIAYIAQTSNKDKLLNYVLQKIQTSVSRNNYSAGVNLYLNYLMRINENFDLSKQDYARIVDVVKDISIYDYLLGETSMRPLEDFSQKLASETHNELNDKLKKFFNGDMANKSLDKSLIRDGVLYGCTIWNSSLLNDLKEKIFNSYKDAPAEIFNFDYGDNTPIVFSENIQDNIIESQFDEQGIVEKDNNLFLKLIERIRINEQKLALAIEKISEKAPLYSNSKDVIDQTEQYSNYLAVILSTLPQDYTLRKTDSLDVLTGKLFRNYNENTYNRINQVRAFFLDNQELTSRTNFIDCFFQISRIAKKVIVLDSYLKLMLSVEATRHYLLEKLNALLTYKFPLSQYKDSIFSVSELSPELLKLYKYLFTIKSGGKYIIDESIIKQKSKIVLDQVVNKDSQIREEAEKLILSLFADERCTSILVSIVSAETTEYIKELPASIQKYIIPVFNEHFEEYADKMSIMHVMAASTNQELIDKVVTKIVNMLTTQGKEKDAFGLIKDLKQLDDKNKNMLLSTLDALKLNSTLEASRNESISFLKGKDKEASEDSTKQ